MTTCKVHAHAYQDPRVARLCALVDRSQARWARRSQVYLSAPLATDVTRLRLLSQQAADLNGQLRAARSRAEWDLRDVPVRRGGAHL